jgi:hypothetical protein
LDSERVFLLAPEKGQFDSFGQRLRGKLRRLVTRSDGLDAHGGGGDYGTYGAGQAVTANIVACMLEP